jgi:hypothetical protein
MERIITYDSLHYPNIVAGAFSGAILLGLAPGLPYLDFRDAICRCSVSVALIAPFAIVLSELPKFGNNYRQEVVEVLLGMCLGALSCALQSCMGFVVTVLLDYSRQVINLISVTFASTLLGAIIAGYCFMDTELCVVDHDYHRGVITIALDMSVGIFLGIFATALYFVVSRTRQPATEHQNPAWRGRRHSF